MGSSRRLILLSTCAVAAGCAHRRPSSRPPTSSTSPASPKPIRLEEVPVGGGILIDLGNGILLTRPDAATVKAYSASCTHEGCVITAVEQGEMVCPCHGSRFRISDGAVTRGPARRPLDPIPVAVVDGLVTFP